MTIRPAAWADRLVPGVSRPGAQYLAGGRVTVTEDPRLSVTVRLHELRVPHGSRTAAVSATKPSSEALFDRAGMITWPVEVTDTE